MKKPYALRKKIILGSFLIFIFSILYVPVEQTYYIGRGFSKSGFLGNWTWVTSLYFYRTYFSGDIEIPATISIAVLMFEWLVLLLATVGLIWLSKDSPQKEIELASKKPTSPKDLIELQLDSTDLTANEILACESFEEFTLRYPNISKDQAEALWDYFSSISKPKSGASKAKSSNLLNPVSTWPFPKEKD